MVSDTKERALEEAIEKHLTGTSLEEMSQAREHSGAYELPFSDNHGYQLGLAKDYDAHYAIDKKFFWQFLDHTQAEELTKIKKSGADWQRKILERFDRMVRKYGLLHLLKKDCRSMMLIFT